MLASAPPHRTVIQQTFPLEQISDAFAALAAGTHGKIVLVIETHEVSAQRDVPGVAGTHR